MGYAGIHSLDCAIHKVVKSRNRTPRWREAEDLHFHYVAHIKGHQFTGKRLSSPHLPTPSLQPEKRSGAELPVAVARPGSQGVGCPTVSTGSLRSCFSVEREGLAPGRYRGSTEIELRHTFGELMDSSDGCSTSLLCYGYQMYKTFSAVPARHGQLGP